MTLVTSVISIPITKTMYFLTHLIILTNCQEITNPLFNILHFYTMHFFLRKRWHSSYSGLNQIGKACSSGDTAASFRGTTTATLGMVLIFLSLVCFLAAKCSTKNDSVRLSVCLHARLMPLAFLPFTQKIFGNPYLKIVTLLNIFCGCPYDFFKIQFYPLLEHFWDTHTVCPD